jgi:ABC-type bacteriocin/lantibiotic exporter with double-glycine peptidase domain
VHSYLGTFLSLFHFDRRRVALSILLSITQSITLLPIGLVVRYLFDNVHDDTDTDLLLIGLLSSLLLISLNTIIVLYNKHLSLTLIKNFISDVREKLIHRLIFTEVDFHDNEDLDRIHSQIIQDTERVDNMMSAFLTQLLPSVIVTIGLSAVLIHLNGILFILMTFFLPIVYAVGKRIGRRLKSSIRSFHEDFAEFSAGVSFILRFHDLIRLSSAEQKEFSRQRSVLRSVKGSSKRVAWNASAYNTIQGNLIVVGGFAVLLFGGFQVMNGRLTLGSLVSFYVILNVASTYLKTIVTFIPVLVEGRNSIESLDAIMGYEATEVPTSGGFSFTESIRFKDVGFSYGQRDVLSNVNFEIKKHQFFVITGESGSGKTTLIKLLLGVHRVKSGQVLIDGRNIETVDRGELRKRIGFLPQDPVFFTGTIHENLVYGLDDIDPAEIEFHCKKCLIHDFIVSLPNGYQTEIGNGGKRISGGQRQRLAIARALIRKPEILVLDEPDKNLDGKSISDILAYIRQSNTTTILITHDDSILSNIGNRLRL